MKKEYDGFNFEWIVCGKSSVKLTDKELIERMLVCAKNQLESDEREFWNTLRELDERLQRQIFWANVLLAVAGLMAITGIAAALVNR